MKVHAHQSADLTGVHRVGESRHDCTEALACVINKYFKPEGIAAASTESKEDEFFPINPGYFMDLKTAVSAVERLGEGFCVTLVLTREDPFFLLIIKKGLKKHGDLSTATPLAKNLLNEFNGAYTDVNGRDINIFASYRGKPPLHTTANAKHKINLYTEELLIGWPLDMERC